MKPIQQMAITFKPFNAKTVPLAGINLIEASAGTGKTYSIALLVLRLIIEIEIPIQKILMVTFTKAAVAELENRIRIFVREAHHQAQNNTFKSDDIGKLLSSSIKQTSHQNVTDLLKNAVLFLDETSVLTIHSFCQLTLTEFAFETQQLFGAELLQDTSTILQDEVNQFWRNNVTGINTELLAYLLPHDLSRENICNAVKEHINGKRFFLYDGKEDYSFNDEEILNEIELSKIEEERLKAKFYQFIEDNTERLNSISQVPHAKKSILKLNESIDSWLNAIQKSVASYVNELYPDILEMLVIRKLEKQVLEKLIKKIIHNITCNAIKQVSLGIYNYKLHNNQLSFDDLINNLNAAILKTDNTKLIEGLQNKYSAVFIDEFQDTDRKQYQIFDTSFNTNTIVFYIGDPKQSIYAWRKADIFTYFEAQKAADNCYSMNHNYRSATVYIDAMNKFFTPEENFDAFHFKGSEQTIDYIKVEAPNPNTKGNLLNGNVVEVPITISYLNSKPVIELAVANKVYDLLKPDSPFAIMSGSAILSEAKNLLEANNILARPIKPSDIGILVRSKKDGVKIKNQLSKLGIPSVAVIEAKILQSAEATYMLYFLLAVADISRSKINTALLSPFTGYSKTEILTLDIQHTTQLFRKYKTLWDGDGVFAAIKTFMADYQTVEKLNQQNASQSLTNFYQLTELLHKTQTSKKLNDINLISWLNRGINGQANEGDEYEQRIESDEEAVKISTIHASKGLEYNIVFAPYLDIVASTKHKFCSFREPETGQYITIAKADLNDEQAEILAKQEAQENSRLIYVTVTRAIYKCFIYRSKTSKSALTHFTNLINDENPQLISQISEYPPTKPNLPLTTSYPQIYTPDSYQNHLPLSIRQTPVNFQLLQKNWYKLSYSFLKAPYQYHPTIKSNQKLNAYDNFIFNDLAKGAKTGNMLHYIFENVQFDTPNNWPRTIINAIKNFATTQTEDFKAKLLELLNHSLNTNINIRGENFKLSDINAQNCINELEFDFVVSPFKIPQLKTLEDDNIEINLNAGNNLEGVMNGKIDLFFEYQGKYYVLDWKSNYLGDSLENYQPEALNQAMNQSNYHLQYLIYTLASKKYLESRMLNFNYETQFGGVIYLFLRGMREGLNSGIFINKPSLQKIDLLNEILSN